MSSGLVLVSGGVRSGKSRFALQRAAQLEGRRTFIATAEAIDAEMGERIRIHRLERGDGFHTTEAPVDVPEALVGSRASIAVVDCITIWLSNLMHRELSDEECLSRVDELIAACSSVQTTIVVSNEVGCSVVPPNKLARRFRDLTGAANQAIARAADEVWLTSLGRALRLKPNPPITIGVNEP